MVQDFNAWVEEKSIFYGIPAYGFQPFQIWLTRKKFLGLRPMQYLADLDMHQVQNVQ